MLPLQEHEGYGSAEVTSLEGVLQSYMSDIRQLFSRATQRVALPALWADCEQPPRDLIPQPGDDVDLPSQVSFGMSCA